MARSGLSARFALACAEASTNDRDELIRLVYHRVHCRLAGDGGWSDRGSAAECLRRASAALADRRVRHPGFASAAASPDGRTVLLDEAGIKVFAPPGTELGDRPPIVRVPTLGLAQEGRWLIWPATPGAPAARLRSARRTRPAARDSGGGPRERRPRSSRH